MPTYYGNGTAVELSVADLDRTTWNYHTQETPVASESIGNVAQEFTNGSIDGTLYETTLNTDFLGEDNTMPFFMVHAGKNFFDSATNKRNKKPFRVPRDFGTVNIESDPNYIPPLKPQALCLTVFLSNRSITEPNDVKIDVYFNGALCDSHYVPQRFLNTEHIVRFTGRRIGHWIEKPWIFIPSGQNPDGSLGRPAYAGAPQHRWKSVSNVLKSHAYKLGKNEVGECPVIGNYLKSLADLSMPKEVDELQKAGCLKYGILDVVILWGKGNENDPAAWAPYLEKPTPIRNEGFTTTDLKYHSPAQHLTRTTDSPHNAPPARAPYLEKSTPIRNEGFTTTDLKNHSPAQHVTRTTDSPHNAPQSPSEALADAKSIDGPSDTSPTLSPSPNTTTTPGSPSPTKKLQSPALPIRTPVKQARSHKKRPRLQEGEVDSDPLAPPRKRNAAHDAKQRERAPTIQALQREVALRKAEAILKTEASDRERTSTYQALQRSEDLLKAEAILEAEAILKAEALDRERALKYQALQRSEDLVKAEAILEAEALLKAEAPDRERAPTYQALQRSEDLLKAEAILEAEALGRGFVTPALSADCSITYAKSGVVRNVGRVRHGVFRDRGVVLGARFIVGG